MDTMKIGGVGVATFHRWGFGLFRRGRWHFLLRNNFFGCLWHLEERVRLSLGPVMATRVDFSRERKT